MAKLTVPNSEENGPAYSRGVLNGIGRVIWAVNWAGEFVKYTMHRPEVRYSAGLRGKEWVKFIDETAAKYRRAKWS